MLKLINHQNVYIQIQIKDVPDMNPVAICMPVLYVAFIK